MLQYSQRVILGLGLILCYDLSNGKGEEIWYLEIFKKWDVEVWTGSSWLRIGAGGGRL